MEGLIGVALLKLRRRRVGKAIAYLFLEQGYYKSHFISLYLWGE
jgi:hypothetical protein